MSRVHTTVSQLIGKSLRLLAGGLALWSLVSMTPTAHGAMPGKDGDLTVSAPNTILNQVSALSQSATAGDTYLRVTNLSALLPLSAGDLLVVYQAFGASIDTTNSPSFGNITAINGAGLYEICHCPKRSIA